MSRGINYLNKRDYQGFQNPQGLSLESKNQIMDSKSTYHYQPTIKDRLATDSGVTSQAYFQSNQYQKQSEQRYISPNTTQISRYHDNKSINSYSQSDTKYSNPSYQQDDYLAKTFSSQKDVLNNSDILNRQQPDHLYNNQQKPLQFNNSQALRSPYISRYSQSIISPYIKSGAVRSTSEIKSQSQITTEVNGGSRNTQKSANQSVHSYIPVSINAGLRANTNTSDYSNSYSDVYSSQLGKKVVVNHLQNLNQEREGYQNEETKNFSPYQQVRSYSTNVQRNSRLQQEDILYTKNNLARQDSLSPSRRVTFNLDRNIYTDVDQIEQRLNEPTRQRPIGEDDNINFLKKTSAQNYNREDDLSKRFDEAIYRSEKIISDCLRIGREENSASNCLSTPTGSKLIRNPSRSKSPIKSSLKRNSSFGSPQRQENEIPNDFEIETQPKHQIIQNQQRFSDMLDNSIINKPNKAINDFNHFDKSFEIRKTNESIIQNSCAKENQNKSSPLSSYNNSKINTQKSDISTYQRTSYHQRNLTNQENDSSYSKTYYKNQNPNPLKIDQQQTSELKKIEQKTNAPEIQNQQQKQNQTATQQQNTSLVKSHKGFLKYSDGSRYDGEILNNQRHGFGTLISNDFQVIYQGTWENDTYHGQGKFFNLVAENIYDEYDYNDFNDALNQCWESYEGEFFEGKLDGFGTLMLTNGEKLVGNFKKGTITGKGTFYCNKGPAVTGCWENNSLQEKH